MVFDQGIYNRLQQWYFGKLNRFAQALDWWQRGRVIHAQRIPVLEEQAVGFPDAAYDDVIDAAVAGVQYFLQPEQKIKAGSSVRTYM